MHPSEHSQESKISVGLYIYGDSLDPNTATRALGVSPTIQRVKGETITSPNGEQICAKTGLWAKVLHAETADQIEGLLSTIACYATKVGLLPNATHMSFDLYVGRDTGASGIACLDFDISAETLAALATAALPLRITFAAGPP